MKPSAKLVWNMLWRVAPIVGMCVELDHAIGKPEEVWQHGSLFVIWALIYAKNFWATGTNAKNMM